MADDSNSENSKKDKKHSKLPSKKGKGTKDPNRRIADLANRYSKLSRQIYPYEDIMKKASFGDDLERQMRGTHDVMRIMEESTRISRQMDSVVMRLDLPEMLGLNSLGEAAKSAIERARDVLENIARYPLDQLNSYQDFLKNSVYFRPLKDVIGDFSEKYAWVDSLKINPIKDILEDIEGIHNIKFKDIFNITSEMKEFYSNLPDDEIVVQEDQSIACAGKAYEISDIEKALREKLENSGFLTDTEIGKKNFDALLSGLEKIGEPSLKSIIYSFLISMFVAIIIVFVTPHLENMQKNLISKNKTTVTKFIQRELPKTLPDKNALYSFRFVTANPLFVWRINRQRSELIRELLFGSVVRVICPCQAVS